MRRRDIDVLLVEDDGAIRETLAEVLTEEGYIVSTAMHGAQALDHLTCGLRPRLILLDLMMPVMTGWDLMARVADEPALWSVPVIVVSGAGATRACTATRSPAR